MSDVNLNMDFTQPVCVPGGSVDWVPSPQAGIERRRLERENAESGRATSFVRYEPGRFFPPHSHPAGEEILVLDGIFSDQNGHFGSGVYLRNPPGSSHAPFTEDGCVIFVKLCQMAPKGEPSVVVDSNDEIWQAGSQPGHSVLPLHATAREIVTLQKLAAAAPLTVNGDHGGLEILVVDGELGVDGEFYGRESWLRLPPGHGTRLSSRNGCRFWSKSGHLRDPGI